jgi:hypothetical protein
MRACAHDGRLDFAGSKGNKAPRAQTGFWRQAVSVGLALKDKVITPGCIIPASRGATSIFIVRG